MGSGNGDSEVGEGRSRGGRGKLKVVMKKCMFTGMGERRKREQQVEMIVHKEVGAGN